MREKSVDIPEKEGQVKLTNPSTYLPSAHPSRINLIHSKKDYRFDLIEI